MAMRIARYTRGKMPMIREEYLALLQKELVPALGCTEPIAIAYAAARCRRLLGFFPEHMTVSCSGNIIKNVKGVIVPTTGDMRGVDTSALLGALAGNPELEMEVLRDVKPSDVDKVRLMRAENICEVRLIPGGANLHILVEMTGDGHTALVEIMDAHTHVIREEKDGHICMTSEPARVTREQTQRRQMTVGGIYEFANTVPLKDIVPILKPQVDYNLTIAREGLRGEYGAQVGRTCLESGEQTARRKAIAYAAAGSDARMSGCALPVVINSGSGNQGMTVSLPAIMYAAEMKLPEEKMYRALALSNLIALYQKSFIGELSAYCGVISAACGSAAAIAYLCGDDLKVISDSIINTIADVSGMVCDGAKPSCAAKIATAVEAAFMGHDMARRGKVFQSGEGLVKNSVDETIAAFGRMGREGMRATDEEILHIMVDQ